MVMRKYLLILLLLPVFAAAQSPLKKLVKTGTISPPTTFEFITSPGSGTLRSDYGDFVGCAFTVGASNITVSELGRWVVSGNSGTHTIKITDAANVTIVSASINTSGLSVGYNYVACTPTVLTSGVTYYIFSGETNGGDQWYNAAAATCTAAGTIDASMYIIGGVITLNATGSETYVPINFKYN